MELSFISIEMAQYHIFITHKMAHLPTARTPPLIKSKSFDVRRFDKPKPRNLTLSDDEKLPQATTSPTKVRPLSPILLGKASLSPNRNVTVQTSYIRPEGILLPENPPRKGSHHSESSSVSPKHVLPVWAFPEIHQSMIAGRIAKIDVFNETLLEIDVETTDSIRVDLKSPTGSATCYIPKAMGQLFLKDRDPLRGFIPFEETAEPIAT